MYRIGIIGSENSHAMVFSEIFNLSDAYPDMRVVAVYGEDPEASRKIFDKCAPECIAKDPAEMLGKVNAVMVTSRNGKLHLGYAAPFIQAGIPAFVDKPIANRAEEALALATLAQEKNVPIMGGSSVKFVPDTLAARDEAQKALAEGKLFGGHVWAPVSMFNEYGNFYFYSSHLVELALTIFGYDPLAVTAVRGKDGVSATLEYANFAAALSFTDGLYKYGAVLLTKDGSVLHDINIDGGYDIEAGHYAHMLRTGETPQSTREMILPVYVLNAIERAYTLGTKQLIGM